MDIEGGGEVSASTEFQSRFKNGHMTNLHFMEGKKGLLVAEVHQQLQALSESVQDLVKFQKTFNVKFS